MSLSHLEIQQYSGHRQKMVEEQLMDRGIKDLPLLEAMSRLPRHLFVSSAFHHKAYGDHPLPIGENQTISQPYTVGLMTASLELTDKDKVLEIGTGSGYQTAVLAELVEQVFTIERSRAIGLAAQKRLERFSYKNIVFKIFDGAYGWRDQAPFDAILVAAGVPEVPKPLTDQLKDGGRMVIPIGDSDKQRLVLVTKKNGLMFTRELLECKFVNLVGKLGWPEK